MPRKDVPYGGAICSLKERIAEIWDKLGEKLHSINGVQGDGQGNVQIESGDDAVVINNDQIGHKIKVSLDAALQAKIDSANAAIDMKVDRIATAGTSAYTHDGPAQGETAVVDGTAAGTIPIRNPSGRLQAADPGSGATNKTLVTANWVSQSGDTRPNNLIHKQGTELIYGMKIFQSGLLGTTIQLKTIDMHFDTPGTRSKFSNSIQWVDQEGNPICNLWVEQKPNGGFRLGIDLRKSDKTWSFGHTIYETN